MKFLHIIIGTLVIYEVTINTFAQTSVCTCRICKRALTNFSGSQNPMGGCMNDLGDCPDKKMRPVTLTIHKGSICEDPKSPLDTSSQPDGKILVRQQRMKKSVCRYGDAGYTATQDNTCNPVFDEEFPLDVCTDPTLKEWFDLIAFDDDASLQGGADFICAWHIPVKALLSKPGKRLFISCGNMCIYVSAVYDDVENSSQCQVCCK